MRLQIFGQSRNRAVKILRLHRENDHPIIGNLFIDPPGDLPQIELAQFPGMMFIPGHQQQIFPGNQIELQK